MADFFNKIVGMSKSKVQAPTLPTGTADYYARKLFAIYKDRVTAAVEVAAANGAWSTSVPLDPKDLEAGVPWSFEDLFFGNPKKFDISYVPVLSRLSVEFSKFLIAHADFVEDAAARAIARKKLDISWQNTLASLEDQYAGFGFGGGGEPAPL